MSQHSEYSQAEKAVLEVLEEIRSLLIDRGRAHGDFPENFNGIAADWSDILNVAITAEQVCLMLAALKVRRQANSHKPWDAIEENLTDMVGYGVLGLAMRHLDKPSDSGSGFE